MFLLFVCVALRGQKSIEKQQMRIQEGHFLKIALNLGLLQNYWFRCIMRRVTVIFRQQKDFGTTVIYFVLGTSIENQQMRIQEGHFLKIALNLVLTLPDDGERPAHSISCGSIDL